ncbi:MAG: hypothetical protein KC502_02495 [Myxococcales bacterium]|nr:hypothetical protein [Myxococcales bacterium]
MTVTRSVSRSLIVIPLVGLLWLPGCFYIRPVLPSASQFGQAKTQPGEPATAPQATPTTGTASAAGTQSGTGKAPGTASSAGNNDAPAASAAAGSAATNSPTEPAGAATQARANADKARAKAEAARKASAEEAAKRAADSRAAAARARAGEAEAKRAGQAAAQANKAAAETRAKAQKAAAEAKRAAAAAKRAAVAEKKAENKRRKAEAAKARAEKKRARTAAKAQAKRARAASKAQKKAERAQRAAEAVRKRKEAAAERKAESQRKAEAERAAKAERLKQEQDTRLAEAESRRKAVESERRAEAARLETERKANAQKVQHAETVALKEGSSGALLGFVAAHPAGMTAAVHAGLVKAANAEAAQWLVSAGQGTPSKGRLVRVRPLKKPATIEQDLSAAKAERWVALAPAEVSVPLQTKNPTTQPAVISLDVGGHPVHVFVGPGASRSVTAKVACTPKGEAARITWPAMLVYRYECDTNPKVRVMGIVAVRAEIAADKRAISEDISLKTAAKILKIVPNSQLAPVWADWMTDRLRRRAHDTGSIRISVKKLRGGNGRTTPIEVRGSNGLRRDVMALYDAGTGRVEKLRLSAKRKFKLRLEGQDTKLKGRILLITPKPRSTDWLSGVWSIGSQTLLLGDGSQDNTAIVIERVPGSGYARTVATKIERTDNGFGAPLALSMNFLRVWFGDLDMLPLTCANPCPSRIQAVLTRQDRIDVGGGRQLELDIVAGGRRKRLHLRSAY